MVKLIDVIDVSNIGHFISNLYNGIFKSLRKPKGIDCNLLLVEVKNKNGIFRYIKKADGTIIPPTSDVLKDLNNELFKNKNKLCSFKVNKGYINEQYQQSNISLVLFSKTINKRTQKVKYIICGLLFLKEIVNSKNNNLYIPLICCKPGIGSGFMLMAEKIAQDLGYHKLTLNSMADPLGFYIHKGFQLEQGNDVYTLENPMFLNTYNESSGEIRTMYQNAANHATYLSEKGSLISHRDRKRTLTKKVKGQPTRAQKKFLGKSLSSLMGVKKKGNEIGMFKKFKKSNRNPVYRIGPQVIHRIAGKKTKRKKRK